MARQYSMRHVYWIVAIVGGGLYLLTRIPQSPPAPDPILAWNITQEFVEKDLVAPATAKFPSYTAIEAVHLGGERYEVHGYVDAENQLGAMVRKHFTAIVKNTGLTWELESLDYR